jgi:hypothetical protein
MANIVLPGANVQYAAGKFGWDGVSETPQFKHKMRPIPPMEEYTLNYTVLFKEGFEWRLGGKLPGLAGGSGTTGCNPIDPNGWSVRFMWREHGRAVLYLYDQKRKEFCGDDIDLDFHFEIGKVHTIVLKIKVNKPDQSDGEISVWIDQVHLKTLSNIKLRGNISGLRALVDTFMFSTFYGGQGEQWAPTHTTEIAFSNFELSVIP